MPHDKQGYKIDHGDYVVAPAWYRANKLDVFKVHGVSEGSTSCNVNASSMANPTPSSMNASDCQIVLKGDGSLPVPPSNEKPEAKAPTET